MVIMKLCKQLVFILAALASGFKSFSTDRHIYPGSSIQAQIDLCVSGDKVIIHAGNYAQAISIISKSGITLTSSGDGEVVLAGDGSSTHTVFVQNCSAINILNLTIKNSRKQAWSTGITIIGSGSGFTIAGNKITDISYVDKSWDASDNPGSTGVGANGIAIIGDNANTPISSVTVTNNEVSYCITGWSEGISLKGNISGFNIGGNIVHHITNIGIDVLGLATYPNLSTNNQPNNGTVKGNLAYNCICNYTDNGAIYMDGATNVLGM